MTKIAKVRSCAFDKKTGQRIPLGSAAAADRNNQFERVEPIDLVNNPLFMGLDNPLSVAQKYESFWNDIGNSDEVVCVIEVIIE